MQALKSAPPSSSQVLVPVRSPGPPPNTVIAVNSQPFVSHPVGATRRVLTLLSSRSDAMATAELRKLGHSDNGRRALLKCCGFPLQAAQRDRLLAVMTETQDIHSLFDILALWESECCLRTENRIAIAIIPTVTVAVAAAVIGTFGHGREVSTASAILGSALQTLARGDAWKCFGRPAWTRYELSNSATRLAAHRSAFDWAVAVLETRAQPAEQQRALDRLAKLERHYWSWTNKELHGGAAGICSRIARSPVVSVRAQEGAMRLLTHLAWELDAQVCLRGSAQPVDCVSLPRASRAPTDQRSEHLLRAHNG